MHACTNCGTKIEESAHFCSNCGTKVVSPLREANAPSPNRSPVQNQTTVDSSNWQATAGLVLGILSVLFCKETLFGILVGILGIVFGAIGRKSPSSSKRQQAGWGLGLGIAGFVISVLSWLFLTSLALFFGGGVRP